MVVVTGLSGSGKSSLAFDTLLRRRATTLCRESLCLCATILGQMDKPDVDSIDGLSPAISIDQKTTSKTRAQRWGRSQKSMIIYDCYLLG